MKKIILVPVFLLAGFLGGIFSIHFFSQRYIEKFLLGKEGAELLPIELTEVREITITENEAIVEGVKKVQRAVVGIETITRAGKITGSGLILSSDGLMVTLAEIVPVGSNFKIFLNGDQVAYEVIKRDTKLNLALIKIEGERLPTLEFADSDRLEIGERVFLVGSIFNPEGNLIKSVNEGIVSRISQDRIRTNIKEEKSFLGSSLFNTSGMVLGINQIARDGTVYTIPSSQIKEFTGF